MLLAIQCILDFYYVKGSNNINILAFVALNIRNF